MESATPRGPRRARALFSGFARMKISVVIVTLNGARRIAACLDRLRATRWPDLEVIVVDNGSTDGVARIVRERYPEVRLLRLPRNFGFAAGNNYGAIHARGEWIALLNDDTEAEPGWLEALMDFARRHPRAGALGCLLLYPDGRTIQHGGGVTHPHGLTDHLDWGRAALPGGAGDAAAAPPAPAPRQCDYVTGAAMLIRREVWEAAGPLDPGYFPIYFEENELCHRAREAGWEVWVVPEARVIHHESQTQRAWSRRFLVRYHRNRIRFLLKTRAPRDWPGALKAEIRWLARHRPYNQIAALALAYAQALMLRLSGR